MASPEVIADDVPERILLSTIDLRGPWEDWKNVGETEVRRPLESWEIRIVTDICSMRRPGNLGSQSLGSGSQTKPEPEY